MWPAFGFFLLTCLASGTIDQAQAQTNDKKATELRDKKWDVIDGFRSAKFGMSKQQLLRAIAKDFNIAKNKVEQKALLTEKTIALNITVPKLLPLGGTAHVAYILGYKSKKLFRVNVLWGLGIADKVERKEVLSTANILKTHFISKRYQKKMYAVNAKVDDKRIIVFRGLDKKGRMIHLSLISLKVKETRDKKDSNSHRPVLRLSYVLDPANRDTLKGKKGKF